MAPHPAGRRPSIRSSWRRISIASARSSASIAPVILFRQLAHPQVELGVADLPVLRLLGRLELGATTTEAIAFVLAPDDGTDHHQGHEPGEQQQRKGVLHRRDPSPAVPPRGRLATPRRDSSAIRPPAAPGYARVNSRPRRAEYSERTRRRRASGVGHAAISAPRRAIPPPIQIHDTSGETIVRKAAGGGSRR